MDTDGASIDAEPESRAERHLRLLQELAEIGMDIARAVRAEAVAEADAAEPAPSRFGNADPGLVFSRIARAVRQTLALEARIAEGIATARVEEDKRRADEASLEFDLREQEVRDYVIEAIEAEAAERQAPDSHIERLLDDLDERMNEGDYDEALADGPIGELVARICADLGVTPDWSLWDDQDWAIEHLAARRPDDVGAQPWARLDPPGGARPPDPQPPNSS